MSKRKIFSIKQELLDKSKEAMLSAVQIYNNPNINFKSETFIVLLVISWTYLLHAYFKDKKIDYRYFKLRGTRRFYDKTKKGAYKYWELERCIDDLNSPIDDITKLNLKFLIGIRHEIEHQMTTKIDDLLSARFQASCLNYNEYLILLFGDVGIEKYLTFSLQFSSISEKQIDLLSDKENLPKNIGTYITDFDDFLTDDEFNSSKYSYRALIFQKQVNRKGQADKVIEFIDPNSELAKGISSEYWVTKEREKTKYLPGKIVEIIKGLGKTNFNITQHTNLWQKLDGKNVSKGYGVEVEGKWYWYNTWLKKVKEELGL